MFLINFDQKKLSFIYRKDIMVNSVDSKILKCIRIIYPYPTQTKKLSLTTNWVKSNPMHSVHAYIQ